MEFDFYKNLKRIQQYHLSLQQKHQHHLHQHLHNIHQIIYYLDADGDVTISTDATGGVQGEITLDATLAINLDSSYTGGSTISFEQATSQWAAMFRSNTSASTNFRLYEGDNLGTYTDYFQITSLEHAATTISTVDDNAAAGHITIDPDGELNLTPETEVKSDAPLKIKEAANAVADTAAYGQLWVKTATPNQLYFTTDAGDDIQITSGTSMAGGGASALNDLSDVTYSSGDLTIASLDKIIASTALTIQTTDSGGHSSDLTFDVDGDVIFDMDSDGSNRIKFDFGQAGEDLFQIKADSSSNAIVMGGEDGNYSLIRMFEEGGVTTNDYFQIFVESSAVTTISTVDANAANGNLNFQIDGSINFDVVGTVEFDGCGVGFDLVTPTYNASDTNVDFLTGNKQFVTFGAGNITDLNLIFPKTSGNFTLLLKQDGTGSRTVTNYKVWDRVDSSAASGSATVLFAGGSNPTLTTTANKTDIISFFYDADNEIAYGVASLNF